MVLRRVLLIGDHCHSEFARATAWLAAHSLLAVAETPAEAIKAFRFPALAPELIVVAQAHPAQFAQTEIELVHRMAPLARLAVLAGSWCEGEMRTGHPWSGVQRLYWHQGESRLRSLLNETSPLWTQPRTATDVEQLLGLPTPRRQGGNRLLAIGTPSSITYQGLAATCAAAGYATVWVAPGHVTMFQHAAAGIWDEGERVASLHPLRAFLKQLGQAPAVALVNFPRLADYQRLQDEGISQLLAKPFLNADLMEVLEQQLQPGNSHQRQSESSAA